MSQQRENGTQSTTSLYRNSKMNLLRNENEILLKWLKRQNVFKKIETIDNIISTLIYIGRVDLAYIFKIENFTNQSESQ